MELLALAMMVVGAGLIGFAVSGFILFPKVTQMANSASQLAAVTEPFLTALAAKDAALASVQAELDGVKADLAADEQAIADFLAKLPPAPAA